MQRNKCLGTLRTGLLIVAATLTWASGAAAGTYKIIHFFQWPKIPSGNLTFDAAGNLYGTTQSGGGSVCGGSGCGTVWKLARNPKGIWTVSIIHSFTGADGADPLDGLTLHAGNLYGTTYAGGLYGHGVVFKLAPNPDGTWTESVLYSFTYRADGGYPWAGVIFDAAGNLYGTTSYGGFSSGEICPAGCGVVFKLAPNPDGTWTESVLHSFTGTDGGVPYAGLIFDATGNLYGTALSGGTSTTCGSPPGCGVVFKLAPNTDGTWTESVLYSFGNAEGGSDPEAGLIFDAAGNLYGTTYEGGAYYQGVVFKLKHNADGTWTESVLHSFAGYPRDGAFPVAGLIFDAAGNLYGTTASDGSHSCGAVFKLKPTSSGWSETIVHSFTGLGRTPAAPVIFDRAGNLYGTTETGDTNYGLVFEITP